MKKLSLKELNRIDIKTFKESDKAPIIIVLDNVRSLNNVGSVFRTSDAFLIKKIILCGITAKPPHREIQKTALGATDSVDWEYYNSTMEAIGILRKENCKIVAVEQADNSIMLDDYKVDTSKNLALIFGNEVKGVDDEVMSLVDECIEIPQFGTKHSFNVSVSAGIVIWDIFNKFEKNRKLLTKSI